MHIDAIKLHPDLNAFLKPLTDDERSTLKRQIIERKKVSDSLKVAMPSGFLLDGYNRVELRSEAIAEGHSIEDPPIEEILIEDGLVPAMEWMRENQRGRRNWTKADDDYAIGKIQIERKKAAHRPTLTPVAEDAKNKGDTGVTLIGKTAATVAEETGCSERSVYRKSKYAEALDTIRATNAKAADDIRSGSLKVSNKDVIAIAASGDIPSALKNLRMGKPWDGEEEAAPAPPKPAKTPVVLDQAKREVPKSLAEVFSGLSEFRQLVKDVGSCRETAKKLAEGPGGQVLGASLTEIVANLKNASSCIKASVPYAVCPKCGGKKCETCQQTGWLTEMVWNGIHPDRK